MFKDNAILTISKNVRLFHLLELESAIAGQLGSTDSLYRTHNLFLPRVHRVGWNRLIDPLVKIPVDLGSPAQIGGFAGDAHGGLGLGFSHQSTCERCQHQGNDADDDFELHGFVEQAFTGGGRNVTTGWVNGRL